MIRDAVPDDLEALAAAIKRRPWHVVPCRGWDGAAVAWYWERSLRRHFQEVLSLPNVEVLIADQGWAVLQHEVEESASGECHTLIRHPSWITEPALLREAVERARRRGALRLGCDVPTGDADEARIFEDLGFLAEHQRIVRPLARGIPTPVTLPPPRGRVRRADIGDHLFLMRLSTETVPHMFHQSRLEGLEGMRGRFFDVYGMFPMAQDTRYRTWVAETSAGVPAGAIMVDPEAERAFDDSWESYIYDLSVDPAFWGGWVGAALVGAVIDQLTDEGFGYLTGDISTDNRRVMSLARRFGFEVESKRYFRLLQGVP